MIGNVGSLVSSLISGFYLLNRRKIISDHFPPFASMQAIFFMDSLLLLSAGFFICGNDLFSDQKRTGYIGLIMSTYSISYMVIAILLTFGMLTSMVIQDVFPSVVMAVSSSMEMVLSILIVNFAGIEHLPGSYACIACAFIMPGMVIIIVGNYSITMGNGSTLPSKKSSVVMRYLSPRVAT